MDDLVLNFISVTGAGVDEARQMLEICNNDLESAVNMFLEAGIGGVAGADQPARGAPQASGAAVKRKAGEEEHTRSQHQIYRQMCLRKSRKRCETFGQRNNSSDLTKADLEKQNTLALLFRPPLEIMFAGTFDQAREHGREKRKWLLANVQKADEFACHTLNRDIWKDEQILRLVREHFVFWQVNSDAPEGKRYARFYDVNEYPYVAIIDARTGELMEKWEAVIDQKNFLAALKEFVSLNDLSKPQASPAKRQKALLDLDEDEQLRQAIAMSMAEAANQQTAAAPSRKAVVDLDSDDDNESSEDEAKEAQAAHGTAELQTRPASEKGKIREPEPEPPADTPTAEVTRLQVRLEDGTRVVRRFLRAQDVQCLFDYVSYLISQDSGFEVMLHKDKLSERIGQTLEQAGVINAAVSVVVQR